MNSRTATNRRIDPNRRRRLSALAALLLGAGCVGSGPGQAASATAAAADIDHSGFDALLTRHVRGNGVDYGGLKADQAELDAYLATLAEVELRSASRAVKLAFYINAYNACTLRLILRHYGRIRSIRDITRPWKTKEWRLAGEVLSLDQIEHGKLRGDLKEPRIHFAVNCASVGCPPLRSRAYTAAGIDTELDAAARAFMRSGNVQFRQETGFFGARYILSLNRIFDWFKGDFQPSVPDFVAGYAGPATAAALRAHANALTVQYIEYDWSLNDAPKR